MDQIDKVINELFLNNARELQKLCNKEIKNFGGISDMDHDDFYSRVGCDITIAKDNYDPSKGKSFKDYVYGVIKLSVWKEMKHRNRGKRQITIEVKEKDSSGKIKKNKEYVKNIPIDAPAEDGIGLCEKVSSDVKVEDEIEEFSYTSLDDILEECSPEMREYSNVILSKLQRKVLELIINGYSREKIMERLHIDSALYLDSIAAITSNKNTRNLRKALEEKKNVR